MHGFACGLIQYVTRATHACMPSQFSECTQHIRVVRSHWPPRGECPFFVSECPLRCLLVRFLFLSLCGAHPLTTATVGLPHDDFALTCSIGPMPYPALVLPAVSLSDASLRDENCVVAGTKNIKSAVCSPSSRPSKTRCTMSCRYTMDHLICLDNRSTQLSYESCLTIWSLPARGVGMCGGYLGQTNTHRPGAAFARTVIALGQLDYK